MGFLKSISSSPQVPYHPLDPSPNQHSRHVRTRSNSFHHRARLRNTAFYFAFVPLVFISTLIIIYHLIFRLVLLDEFMYGYPDVPDYEDYVAWEDSLPQHNLTRDVPNGRYLMFSNQAWGFGLNNQLQEILLLSHLSYLSKRSYVFQPYTWNAKTKKNAVLDGNSWRSSRIPLSVFISGPTAGGSFLESPTTSSSATPNEHERDDDSHRAVNIAWWDKKCPVGKRKKLDVQHYHRLWKIDGKTEGSEILDRWKELLEGLDDACVEVSGKVIFDFGLIASPRVLSIWPTLSKSPILTRFSWSNLIKAAVYRNLPLFFDPPTTKGPPSPPRLPDDIRSLPEHEHNVRDYGRNRRPPSPTFASFSLPANSTSTKTIKGLIAVHLRRGDFKMHCHTLADNVEPFAGWNQFPFLLDRFIPPTSISVWERASVHQTYVERCWPNIEDVVKRLREIRRLNPDLEKVFVLTNGKKTWVEELKSALLKNEDEGEKGKSTTTTTIVDKEKVVPGGIRVQPLAPSTHSKKGWKGVFTSKDLQLLWTEKEIDQAVDMEIARRAEVFLGNGFSSLTSNIVMLRLSDGTPIQNIRFW